MIDSLKKIKNIGYKVKNFLEKGDFESFGQIMNDHWSEKKKRSKIMSNSKINFWYESALKNGDSDRISEADESIGFLKGNYDIVADFEKIKQNPNFKIRVMHHDTKVNNVLFDKGNKGLCVIDLDTVMPGYFMSDVGDMMRTYLSPVSEEEKDFSLIEIREDYFKAILDGYMTEMKNVLSNDELKHFVYAGKFLIYMQALRFLTDYLQKDIYYGSQYPGHNFIRAKNQIVLLKRLIEKEEVLQEMVENYLQ